jgi:hypothetical protein
MSNNVSFDEMTSIELEQKIIQLKKDLETVNNERENAFKATQEFEKNAKNIGIILKTAQQKYCEINEKGHDYSTDDESNSDGGDYIFCIKCGFKKIKN